MNRRGSFREKLQRFMYGRYGQIDALNKFLFVVAFVLYLFAAVLSRINVAGVIIAGLVLNAVSMAAFIIVVVRMMSKNVYKRSAENMKYFEIRNRVTGFFRGQGWKKADNGNKSYKTGATTAKVRPVRDPNYKYFKCPKCKKTLRVPKNHGKVELTCKNCGRVFYRYTGKRAK